jgi:hypothetical protein
VSCGNTAILSTLAQKEAVAAFFQVKAASCKSKQGINLGELGIFPLLPGIFSRLLGIFLRHAARLSTASVRGQPTPKAWGDDPRFGLGRR